MLDTASPSCDQQEIAGSTGARVNLSTAALKSLRLAAYHPDRGASSTADATNDAPDQRSEGAQGVLETREKCGAAKAAHHRRCARGSRPRASLSDLVVDASVAFKWLIPDAAGDDVPAAKALLVDHMEGRVEIAVPALLYYEVANILLFGRSRTATDAAAEALGDLFSIPLIVVAPAPDTADAALRLAAQHGLSYYDASYVALAESLDCTLITADQRLVRRTRASGRVRLLA
ncbi:MAG TPA: type II toxin-antitoxin system VapC family toxin [Thermoanaerobaculia bacterium]